MTTPSTTRGPRRPPWALLLFALGFAGCGDDDARYYDQCRYQPSACAGGLGAVCGSDLECGLGFCCRNPKECGGGMCTLACRSDLDGPVDMGCEHGVCFYSCRSDLDCAAGQHCAHGHTVCEW